MGKIYQGIPCVEADDGMNAISQLLSLPNLQDPFAGGGPIYTAKFGDSPPRRIDYLLPSREIEVIDRRVFRRDQKKDQPGFELVGKASDHRPVWVDIRL